MLFALLIGRKGKDQGTKGDAGYMVSTGQGTPPLLPERQVPFIPIIFRTKKVEKSSPQETIIFRTKNTEKSRLGKIGKNFGKKFAGKCFVGKRKPPILAEIEGEVLIMNKRCVIYSDAKVVELF